MLLLSLVSFALTWLTPGDPVQQRMVAEGVRTSGVDLKTYEREYRLLASRLDYDLPLFYFTVTHAALPDTLHRIVQADRRQTVRRLALRHGDWPRVQQYYRALLGARLAEEEAVQVTARRLLTRAERPYIERQLRGLPDGENTTELRTAYQDMVRHTDRSSLLWPRIYWNGTENRYHRYLLRLADGDLGISYADRRPVAQKIAVALPRTVLLNGLALLVVYLLAIPLGLYMAHYHRSRFDRWATGLTFLAFGLPAFWVATLLANFFTTPAYGMNWFPSMGFGEVPLGAGWWEALSIRASHLLLPVFCLAYPSLAYVSRHLRASTLVELERPYVKTARMKGMTGSQVLWRHVFRNAAFPLVTLLGGLLPGLLAGSVLIEQIFNLPGMGQLLYEAATARDWPVVTALVLVNGVLTILGLLLADIGYALVDPRVRLGKLPPR
ncbi:peptide/nickel transport system permease protein [Lewinella marina]|uniref:ABC transporter permease n=1 Tax=Neolewinella marina TaxID=438751 RepID=UPI00117BA31A|nr:ABC transporter permease [Neolewinella marina]NJB84818.1 peptide/nickel transport system permease protein [Neolewinella marina]